jgi:8-oxo-dGTP pyrophosphatase MutT (NUDIX family)
MAISPYLRRLRESVGHDLLLVPSAAVLVWDPQERLLLVRELHTGMWQTVGGALDPDESPQQAAVREAREEAGVGVELTGIRGVLGGPEFRIVYPNGDEVAYVSTVFDARIASGTPRPDEEETAAVGWFAGAELETASLTPFTRSLLGALGLADGM